MENNRFLKILWSINGVILLGIFVVAGVLLLIELFESLSRSRYSSPEVIVGKDLEKAKKEGLILQGLEFGEPLSMLHSDGYILPVTVKTYENPLKKSRSLKYSSYEAVAEEDYNVSNIIFLNKEMEVQSTLLGKKAFIASFRYPAKNDYDQPDSIQRHISYLIAFADSNKDERIDSQDDNDLYLTDLNGKNLTQVTKSVDVVRYTFLDSNRILIKFTRRTNEEQEHKKEYFSMYSVKEKTLEELASLHNALDEIESQLTQ